MAGSIGFNIPTFSCRDNDNRKLPPCLWRVLLVYPELRQEVQRKTVRYGGKKWKLMVKRLKLTPCTRSMMFLRVFEYDLWTLLDAKAFRERHRQQPGISSVQSGNDASATSEKFFFPFFAPSCACSSKEGGNERSKRETLLDGDVQLFPASRQFAGNRSTRFYDKLNAASLRFGIPWRSWIALARKYLGGYSLSFLLALEFPTCSEPVLAEELGIVPRTTLVGENRREQLVFSNSPLPRRSQSSSHAEEDTVELFVVDSH